MSRRTAISAAGLAVIAALTVAVLSANKQQPETVPTSSDVASRIMSPFCPGLSLDECPSAPAAELRARIERRIEAGATNREIDRWLVYDYGEAVLGRPRHALAWIAPTAFLLTGLGLVFILLGRRTHHTEEPGESYPGEDAERPCGPGSADRARLLEDLSRFAQSTE